MDGCNTCVRIIRCFDLDGYWIGGYALALVLLLFGCFWFGWILVDMILLLLFGLVLDIWSMIGNKKQKKGPIAKLVTWLCGWICYVDPYTYMWMDLYLDMDMDMDMDTLIVIATSWWMLFLLIWSMDDGNLDSYMDGYSSAINIYLEWQCLSFWMDVSVISGRLNYNMALWDTSIRIWDMW